MKKIASLTIILLFLTGFSLGQTADQLKKATELFNQGLAYQNNQEWDKAIESYTEYIKIRPNHSGVWYNRGLARYERGIDFSNNTGETSRKHLEEAVADFTQSIKLNPNFADAWLSRANANLILIRLDLSKYAPLAVADFTQAIKLAPNSPGAYRGRGKAYSEQYQVNNALADFNKAIELNPQDDDAYFQRGKIYFSNKNLNSAKADFQAVLKISPAHPYAKIWLESTNSTKTAPPVSTSQTWQTAFETGKTFLQRNDADNAIASFQKALNLLPVKFEGDEVELLIANQKSLILENIAKSYLVKKDYNNAINNCLTAQKSIYETLLNKYAKIEKFKFDPSELLELSKSKIDLQLINFDLLLAQSTESPAIGKRCFQAFEQNNLTMEQQFSLIGLGALKVGAAEFVSDMFLATSSLRLSLSQLCQGRGKNICGESSRNNEIAKYAGKSLEDINKAIEFSPAQKKLYLHRAEVHRHLGRNDLALADETKASQLK
jgi:tetratricopeptide (TPR) repeat protein